MHGYFMKLKNRESSLKNRATMIVATQQQLIDSQ